MRTLNLDKKMKKYTLSLMLVLLAGCADWSSKPQRVDNNFGKSVRSMVAAQTLNPTAGKNTSAILQGDGQRASNIIKTYRNDITTPQQARETLELDISNN